MNTTLDISAFTPSQMSPEARKAIFVQRHDLLADAVARVKESAETGNKHHLLFVGPRGSGKTLFVSLLVDRIAEDALLAEKLAVAWLNEDETSTSFLDLLLRIYRALAKRSPQVFDEASMEPLYDLNSEAMEEFAIKLLLERIGHHTPLIVVENLDRIFQGIGDEGQKKLRAFLQEHPIFAIVATAQALISDLTDRKGPFYGFFQTEHLKPLILKDAVQLLAKMAKQKEDEKLTRFLETPKGRARARALHFLTGGNHRVFIVLAQFITHDTIESLVQPFLKMVDELTPYYQERVRALPDLQCKITEYLCSCVETVPVKTIARRMLTTHQSVSSQLKDLREKGYVKSHKKGREFLYEVSEPMMRICVEVKENQTRTLGLLVDFIRVWFEAEEIDTRRKKAKAGSLDEIYYAAAYERVIVDGNLRQRILVESLKEQIKRVLPEPIANQVSAALGHIEELDLATYSILNGNEKECLELLLKSGEINEASVLNYRGGLFLNCGANEKANDDFTVVIERADVSTDEVTKALFNRGVSYGQSGEFKKAIGDLTAVIERAGPLTEQVIQAFYTRGMFYGESGEFEKGIADYTAMIELEGVPTEQVAKALFFRGVSYGKSGELEKGIADFTAMIELEGASAEQVAEALFFRGVSYDDSGEFEKGIADFTAVIELEGAPTEQVAEALFFRGVSYGESGEFEKGIADYTAMIELEGAPAEQVAQALFNRAVSYGQSGELEKKMADYTAVIELAGVAAEQVVSALFNRGLEWSRMGRTSSAEKDFDRMLELEGLSNRQSSNAHLGLAELRARQGRWDEAFKKLNEGLLCGEKEEPRYVGDLVELIDILSHAGLGTKALEGHVEAILTIAKDREVLVELGDSLVRHLSELKNSKDPLEPALLERWSEVWLSAAKGIPSLEIPMRMLRYGIAYLASKDQNESLLLNLKSEERYLLRQTLGLESDEN